MTIGPHDVLSEGAAVHIDSGYGKRGVVVSCELAQRPFDANVHTIKITHKYKRLCGNKWRWEEIDPKNWRGSYRFVSAY